MKNAWLKESFQLKIIETNAIISSDINLPLTELKSGYLNRINRFYQSKDES